MESKKEVEYESSLKSFKLISIKEKIASRHLISQIGFNVYF